jgi:hypothetical protein
MKGEHIDALMLLLWSPGLTLYLLALFFVDYELHKTVEGGLLTAETSESIIQLHGKLHFGLSKGKQENVYHFLFFLIQ